MKKKFLLLGLSLLVCGGSVFAEEDKAVKIGTYVDLQKAITEIGKLPALNKTLAEKEATVERILAENVKDSVWRDTTITTKNETTVQFDNFMSGYETYANTGNIYYAETTGRTAVVLVVALESLKESVSKLFTPAPTWKDLDCSQSSAAVTKTAGRFYYKDATGALVFTSFDVSGDLFSVIEKLYSIANGLPSTTTTKKIKVENKEEYADWEKRYNNAQTAVTNAQKDVDAAEAYKSLSLTADITVNTAADATLGIWPADGEINGNGHKIINKSGYDLFTTNNGKLHHLISTDKRIAATNAGTAYDCIVKSTNGYYAYDEAGARSEYTELEDAVYSLRNVFGMDLTKGEVGTMTPETKLYQVKYTDADSKEETSFKANVGTNALIAADYQNGLTLDNVVAYVEDTDAKITFDNVAVKNNSGKYTCAKLTLTDKSAEFYVPYALTATKVEYSRTSKDSLVAVCMPFALNASTLAKNTNGDVAVEMYNFKNVDAAKNTMWFNKVSSVPANTPCILRTINGATEAVFNDLQNVAIASTAGAELSSAATLTGGKCFFGNYKPNQAAGDLTSAHPGFGTMVYGIQGGKLVKMADGSKMHAFRSFVIYGEDISTPAKAPAFRVGLLDENDNEVNAIEAVTTNDAATTFKAVGGDKTIEVTSDKACTVNIYTTSGALVKAVRVEAGTTSLPVNNAGMYIVNKNKVVVK